MRLTKEHHDPRRFGQMRLVLIGAERREGRLPFRRGTFAIECLFLLFRRATDLGFERRITHRDKSPRLLVRTARRRACGVDRQGDELARHRLGGEMPCGPPAVHVCVELLCATQGFVERQAGVRKIYETGGRHGLVGE
jgi:hypothetical protein